MADGDDVTWLYSILHIRPREESARGEGEHTAIDSLSRNVDDSIVAAGFAIELISWEETCERIQDWDGTWWWLDDEKKMEV